MSSSDREDAKARRKSNIRLLCIRQISLGSLISFSVRRWFTELKKLKEWTNLHTAVNPESRNWYTPSPLKMYLILGFECRCVCWTYPVRSSRSCRGDSLPWCHLSPQCRIFCERPICKRTKWHCLWSHPLDQARSLQRRVQYFLPEQLSEGAPVLQKDHEMLLSKAAKSTHSQAVPWNSLDGTILRVSWASPTSMITLSR